MTAATRETILAAAALETSVEAPALGGTVRIRALTAADLSRWADEMKTAPARAPGLLLALSIVGEDGARMFDDNAVEQLASLPAVAVRPVLDAILAHNGLDSAAREAAKGN